MVDKESFQQCVARTLARLYDPAALQTNPLVRLLVTQETPSAMKTQTMRQILIDAVESLRPVNSLARDDPAWLSYKVLSLRFLRRYPESQVCQAIGLGRTSLYKYQKRGIAAVASLLWDQYLGKNPTEAPTDGEIPRASEPEDTMALREATRAAQGARAEAVALCDVFDWVEERVEPLLEQHRLAFSAAIVPSATVYGDPAILRQAILSLLIEAIQGAPVCDQKLGLEVRLFNGEAVCCVRDFSANRQQGLENSRGFAVGRGVLNSYGGRLWFGSDAPDRIALYFAMPLVRPRTILIVDDNPDTLNLYRHYLGAEGYDLQLARSVQEAQNLLANATPDLILLDILMPQKDGWDFLQYLKATGLIAKISILICSVLTQEHLALASGLAEVLQKPVSQAVLLTKVKQLLARNLG